METFRRSAGESVDYLSPANHGDLAYFLSTDYTDYTDFGQVEYTIGRYGRTCVLNHANFQQVKFQLMKDARTVRPYQSSGNASRESVSSVKSR